MDESLLVYVLLPDSPYMRTPSQILGRGGKTYRTREPSSQKIVCSSMVFQKIFGQNTLYSFNYGSWNNYTQQNESITNKSVCREKPSFSMVYVGLEWQFCWLMKPDFVKNHAFWQKILDTKSQVHRKEYVFSTSGEYHLPPSWAEHITSPFPVAEHTSSPFSGAEYIRIRWLWEES